MKPLFPRLPAALPACALSLLLAACATVPRDPALAAAPAPAYRDNVTLSGQIGVDYTQNEQPQHLTAAYRWRQGGADTEVTLLSPLGQIMAVIKAAPGMASLAQANQPLRTAADIDTLTQQALGWPLPVAGLRDWLQGRAVDAQGRPFAATRAADSVTTRDGWRIRYVWNDDANSIRRIELERDVAGQATPVALRITIADIE